MNKILLKKEILKLLLMDLMWIRIILQRIRP